VVGSGRFGYLLKDRVFDVDEFLDALGRVANGGSALDPEVVSLPLRPLYGQLTSGRIDRGTPRFTQRPKKWSDLGSN
jgi:hypothetical protein